MAAKRMSVLREVAQNIGDLLDEFKQWSHLREAFRPEEKEALREAGRQRVDGLVREGYLVAVGDGQYKPADGEKGAEFLKMAEEEQAACQHQVQETRRINLAISDQLMRLNPESVSLNSHTSQDWYDLLEVFAQHYGYAGARRNAMAIMRYLETLCDHYFWIMKQWVAACLAAKDYEAVEGLLEALHGHPAFAASAKYHAVLYMAKALIYANRDGDVQEALEWAERARHRCGTDTHALELWRRVKKQVEALRMAGSRKALPSSTVLRKGKLHPGSKNTAELLLG